jgi:dTDP-4-amino-4,6-dideoxygalactose transaminase
MTAKTAVTIEDQGEGEEMDFIDLAAQQRLIRKEIDEAIARVLAHGQYINGPEVRELEAELAAYTGVKHAVGCASGTDALLMALMALEIGPGDAVFAPPFTFVATAEVISLLGATPVFVDVDPVTFNLCPEALARAVAAVEKGDPALHVLPGPWFPRPPAGGAAAGAEASPISGAAERRARERREAERRVAERRATRRRSGPRRTTDGPSVETDPSPAPPPKLRPRAVIPVDLFGLPADYDAIGAVAAAHGLAVIEDAAQSFGGLYRGRRAGAFGTIACTSFFPAKPLGCYGDGGMCFTDDDALAGVLHSIRVHGQGSDKYDNVRIGINGRLDTLQAAILKAKFTLFPRELELRQEVAARYDALLAGAVGTPAVPADCLSAWAQYSVLARDAGQRAAMTAALKAGGVPTAVYYPIPLHRQKAYAALGYREGDFPVSDDCAGRIFSLPMHPYLAAADQARIAALLK